MVRIDARQKHYHFRLVGLVTPFGLQPDLSTIPSYIHRKALERGGLNSTFEIVRIWQPAPEGSGYMIRYTRFADPRQPVYQGTSEGFSIFYPMSDMPEVGIAFACTKQDAMDTILAITGPRSEIRTEELEIVPYDRALEAWLYEIGKWRMVYPPEGRPVFSCPICKTPNPKADFNRNFICPNCGEPWPAVPYCPDTGKRGYCTGECSCWEKEYER